MRYLSDDDVTALGVDWPTAVGVIERATAALQAGKTDECVTRLEKYLAMGPKSEQNKATAQGLIVVHGNGMSCIDADGTVRPIEVPSMGRIKERLSETQVLVENLPAQEAAKMPKRPKRRAYCRRSRRWTASAA